ncbi:MAG: hypothetical protein WBL67_20400, partial [Nitrososphaeraceae archaeon]
MCNKKNEVSLLAIGIILSSIGLVQALSYPLELRASSDSESGAADLMNRSLLTEFDDTLNLSNNSEDSVYGQVRSSNNNIYVVWQESVPGNSDRNYEIFF